MKVRMKQTAAGPQGTLVAGAEPDVERALAYALIEAGAAEQIEDDPAPKPAGRKGAKRQAATKGPDETAAQQTDRTPDADS